jgi:hypothetical protein
MVEPRRRWKDNIKMVVEGIGFESVNCIHVARKETTGRIL